MTITVRNEREYDIRTALRVHGLWLSGGMTILGLQLLRPETTFMQPIYEGMRQVASENTWATAMLVCGIPRFAMISWGIWTKNGSKAIPPLAILLFAGGCSMIWLAMAVLFLRTNPVGVSCVAFSILAGLDISTCVLLGKLVGAQLKGSVNGHPA